MKILKAGYQGFYLPDLKIALDGFHPDAEFVFVSHAHADHMPRNRSTKAFATPATLDLMNIRGFRGETNPLPFHETLVTDSCSVRLYPAGHILGSAMVYIETESESLLYTGDYNIPPSPASEGFEAPEHADILITEATFGLPIYKWKPIEELALEIQAFAADCLNDGLAPVFLAYNLGKAQEIMHLLAPLNQPIMIHDAGYQLCPVYEKYGIDLGNYFAYNHETYDQNILITPASALSNGLAPERSDIRTAYCSGWAADEFRRSQTHADKMIAISDHLDFFELINFCTNLSPKTVYITHTPNPDVVKYYLKKTGIKNIYSEFETA